MMRASDFVSPLSLFFRLSASDFLLLRQKKVTKEKATPTVPVALCATTLRCSVSEAAAQLVITVFDCDDSDSARRLPLRVLCFSAGPTGAPKRSRPHALVLGPTRRKGTPSVSGVKPRWARREAQAGRESSVADV